MRLISKQVKVPYDQLRAFAVWHGDHEKVAALATDEADAVSLYRASPVNPGDVQSIQFHTEPLDADALRAKWAEEDMAAEEAERLAAQ